MTFTELNAEHVADYGPLAAGDGYTPCIYCGSPEVCCGSPSSDCHCPACHKRDAEEGEWSGLRGGEDDYADVPPEADGDTEDPRYSPYARQGLI